MEVPIKSQLTFGVILLTVLVVASIIFQIISNRPMVSGGRPGIFAVFLSNNQVYFGKIDKESESKMWLKNIYYIQQPKAGEKADDISLLKLGNEIHGPEDMMEINRNQILFIEKLKEDGKVAKAIQSYQQK
ncbi:hypothetical protein IT408_00835 [Candidatus Uhrbacteria bacterium]|nr:hypothetical protein [Candidatus Uhrbacteria bacterium]